MDVKKRLFAIVSLLLIAMVVSLVMMEKQGFSTFYEVRCDNERGEKCQPSGVTVELERDREAKRIVIEKFDHEGKRIDFVQGDDCRIPDNQNFFCQRRSLVSMDSSYTTSKRKIGEPMQWTMTAGKLLNQGEVQSRVYYADGFEFWRRRTLFGWNP